MSRLVPLLLAIVLLPAASAGAQQVQQPAVPASPVPIACPGNPDALGTARTITVGSGSPVEVGLKTYPRTLALEDHEVVLTFDDGPSPRTTPHVLAALEHDCVRAAFFLIGRNAAASPALVRREIADGDAVGHHSWSHPAVTERGLTEAAARADIERGFEADDRAGYGSTAGAPRVPFFRFPGFGDSPALLSWLESRHVAVFGADLWATDWVKQTPQAELALLMGRLDKAGRGIILLHDIKDQTAAMLPDLLHALKAGGYRVAAIAPGSGDTPLRLAPPGWTSATEAAVAHIVARSHETETGGTVAQGRPVPLPERLDPLPLTSDLDPKQPEPPFKPTDQP